MTTTGAETNMPDQTQRYRIGAGYDHTHFSFIPVSGREPFAWPDGAKTAVAARSQRTGRLVARDCIFEIESVAGAIRARKTELAV